MHGVETPADRQRGFVTSFARAATMNYPPAGLSRLAEQAARADEARVDQEEPAARTDDAHVDEQAAHIDHGRADDLRSVFSLSSLRGPRQKATPAQLSAILTHVKGVARRKREQRALRLRLETYGKKIDERLSELQRAANETAGASISPADGARADPIALAESPMSQLNSQKVHRALENRLLEGSPNRGTIRKKAAVRQNDAIGALPLVEDVAAKLADHSVLLGDSTASAEKRAQGESFLGDALAATLATHAKIGRYAVYCGLLSVPMRTMRDLLGNHLAPDPWVTMGVTPAPVAISGIALFVWLIMAGANMLVKGGVTRTGVKKGHTYSSYAQFANTGYAYTTVEQVLSAVGGWSVCHGLPDPRVDPRWRGRIESARRYCRKACDTSRTFRAGAFTVAQFAVILSSMSPGAADDVQAASMMTLAMAFFLRVGEWVMLDMEEVSFVKEAGSLREYLYVLFVLSKGDKNGDGVFRCATHRPHCSGACSRCACG